jgi:SmpA / OmlA family
MHVASSCRPRPFRSGRFFMGLAAAGVLLAGCRGESGPEAVPASVGRVEEGMTMEEVLSVWGTPNVKVREGNGERWSYWVRDDRQRIVGRTYILFDDRRRVSEILQRPEQPPAEEPPPEPISVTSSGASGPGLASRAPGGAAPFRPRGLA